MKKKILIVDDELLIGETWKLCLELEEFEADFVLSVQEAIKKIHQEDFNYDLIITDLKMPEQGGEILLEYLKEHNIKTKIIISSGHMDHDQRFDQYTIEKIIPKPFTLEEEIRKIKQILS